MTKLEITLPSGNIGFVESPRSFCVQGNIISSSLLDDEANLRINILDESNKIVRIVFAKNKYSKIARYYEGLTSYKEELDPGHELMEKYGFPELIVDDLNNIEDSIHKASIKCWFNDYQFKAIIVNASNILSGAMADDGMNFVDDDGKPFKALKLGKYKIEVILTNKNEVIKAYKDFVIDKREYQFICRFNPLSHKQKMLTFCKKNNIPIIDDLLPGYLDSYLGKWFYHMGLLKMYRANDLCLFKDVKALMFDYLIDPTSTSYETELAYLQKEGVIDDENRLEVYHYDIGEAHVQNKEGKIIKFKKDEYVLPLRIDIVNNNAKENIYYLDERHIINSIFDLNNIEVKANSYIQIMGIIKPWQLDKDDFILKDDNTFNILNAPKTIRYILNINGKEEIIDRNNLMERIDQESIGYSVYEFYNLIKIKDECKNSLIKMRIQVYDNKGNYKEVNNDITIKIKE